MITAKQAQTGSRAGFALLVLAIALGAIGWAQPPLLRAHSGAFAMAAFGAATLLSFLAFPRRRRSDLSLALLVLVGFVGLVPIRESGVVALRTLLTSALGVLSVYVLTHVEILRSRMREQPDGPLARLSHEERRAAWSLWLSGARQLDPSDTL